MTTLLEADAALRKTRAGCAWIVALLLVLLICVDGWGCASPEQAERQGLSPQHERALRAVGITGAKAAPYNFFVCADSDSILNSSGFVAGDISGNVCCGLLLKGCTVRTR